MERQNVIRDAASGKRVVFLDEVPWMDTARSDFNPENHIKLISVLAGKKWNA